MKGNYKMPLLLIAKLIIDGISGILNALGGYHWLFCRRFIMPCVIALGVSIGSGIWWLGFTVLPVMGTMCLAYFGGKFWGRGLWLALQATVIGAGSLVLGHLAWWFYVPYIGGALLLAGFLYDLEQLIGDFIYGFWLAVIIFLVH